MPGPVSKDKVRGFYHLPEATEVIFGYYLPDLCPVAEMAMHWYDRADGGPTAARLECFDDAFGALWDFLDVLRDLTPGRAGTPISPEGFCKLLLRRGFRDLTPRQAPQPKDDRYRRSL